MTHEVLPSIRKNGGYVLNQETVNDDQILEKALVIAQNRIAERNEIIEQKEREIKEKDKQIASMKPESEYFKAVCDARLLTNFRDAAKELGMSQSQFVGWLKKEKYIYSTSKGELRPMEAYRDKGLFSMKSYVNSRNGYSGIRTMITPKGVQTFKMLLEVKGIIPEALPKHGGKRGKNK